MPLRMKSLHIEGFKAIQDTTLHWHPRVNIITGPNNSGKTTVLEAMALWAEGFYRILAQAKSASKNRGTRRGDRYLDRAYVDYNQVNSVRSPAYQDLFHGASKTLTITAELSTDDIHFQIPIVIRESRGQQYEFRCNADQVVLNKALNEVCNWPRPFRVLFASPVAAVRISEEFLTPGKTKDMIRRRRTAEVFRNRIHRLHARPNDFERFVDDVGRILTGTAEGLEIRVKGNANEDVHTGVLARNRTNHRFRDISLLGSGSLQIIEVLLNLYLDPGQLDLVLLDEPDSHIHRDIQRRLLATLEQKAENAQVFVTTHNESLLRSAGWDRVFHLPTPSSEPSHVRPVGNSALVAQGRQHGMLASPLRTALASIGAETALDFLNALEADHFLLVEGTSDAALIDQLLQSDRMGGRAETAMFWSLNGIDGLRTLPSLKAVLGGIRNGQTLWQKSLLVLDRDLLTPNHAALVQQGLLKRYECQATFWQARTAESVLLSGGLSATLPLVLQRAAASNLQWVSKPGLQDNLPVQKAWLALKQTLTDRWQNPDLIRLHGSLEQRKNLLDELGISLGGLGPLQEEVKSYHQQAVLSGELWQTATKTDVRNFVRQVMVEMGVSEQSVDAWLAGPKWFQAILTEVTSTHDLPAVTTMLKDMRDHAKP